MEMSASRKLRLWLWVILTAGLAGGLVLIEVSLRGRSVDWPARSGPVALAPWGAARPGVADRVTLSIPRTSGAWVILLQLADEGLSPAPDVRLTAGGFAAAPARPSGGRPSGVHSPEPATWHGFRTGTLRVVVPAGDVGPGTGPVRIRIANHDPGWLILRRLEVYPWWWHGSGVILRLALGIYIGLSVLLLWPLGRLGGVAALQAGSWLAAAGVALSIWQWGRRLIIIDVGWGLTSLIICLLVWVVGQALSVGQLGTFWGAGPAWALGRAARLFRPRHRAR